MKKKPFKLKKYQGGGGFDYMSMLGSMTQASTDFSNNNAKNNTFYNPDIDAPQYAQNPNYGQEQQLNQMSEQGIKQIPGFGQYYQFAKAGSDMGRSMIKKDQYGLASNNNEQAADNLMNPTHQMIIGNISKGQYGEAAMSAFINPAIGSMIGQTLPGDSKFGKKMTAFGRGEKIFSNGGVYNLTHPLNDPLHIIKFPMGGNVMNPNSQLELQENTLNPDGTTTQFDLPSHEQQHPQAGTQLQPDTLIFSDKLKPKGEKITFAKLNKPNNTDKETKILDNKLSNSLANKTAKLMKQVKNNNSLKLFQEQESLKTTKINSYIKRLGGTMKYPDGSYIYNQGKIPDTNYAGVDAKGFPIDATGRRLSNPEMMGFNRPSNTYGSGVSKTYTADYGNSANVGLQNAGGIGVSTPNILPQFTYDPSLVDESGRAMGYNTQWNSYLAKNPLPKNTYGGLVKFSPGGQYGPEQYPITNQSTYQDFIGNPQLRGMQFIGNPNYNVVDNRTQSNSGTDYDYQQYLKDLNDPTNPTNKPQSEGNKMNWGNAAYQAGSWLANNLGELAYLKDQGKNYDKQGFYEYTPERLDPSASLRDADQMARMARYDLADKSVGNSGNYLTNRSTLAINTMLAKDKIRREYANLNAGIGNRGKQYNIQNKYMTDDINARNKGAALNQYYKSLERIGSNTTQGMKDNRAYNTEKDMLPFMKQAFSDPAFLDMFSKYMKSKGVK